VAGCLLITRRPLSNKDKQEQQKGAGKRKKERGKYTTDAAARQTQRQHPQAGVVHPAAASILKATRDSKAHRLAEKRGSNIAPTTGTRNTPATIANTRRRRPGAAPASGARPEKST